MLSTLPPMADLGTSLLNELDRIEQPFIMVLDDYHLINKGGIRTLIAQLYWRIRRNSLHLVIIGRRDPAVTDFHNACARVIDRDSNSGPAF